GRRPSSASSPLPPPFPGSTAGPGRRPAAPTSQRCVAGARLNPMNEERGTRGDRHAEAGPDTGQSPSDGQQAGPALEHIGGSPGRAGAGSWAGGDGPAGTRVRGRPAPAAPPSAAPSNTPSPS